MKFQYSRSVLRANRRNLLSWTLLALLLPAATALQAQTPHATGIDGTTVYLNDLEDHTWTYYSAKPDAQYPDQLRSPDPRNVKITYNAGSVSGASAVQVSPTEPQTTFVYYKTIEKYAWGGTTNTTTNTGRWLTGEYAYRVIPNPFSKRPKNGDTYYGFGGWKITSGHNYVRRENGNMAAANAVLNLEEKINFVGLDYDDANPNAVTAEVVFEATWVEAKVVPFNKNADITNSDPTGLNTSGTYETNFIVVTDSRTHSVSGFTKGVTISSYYPDGTAGGGAPTISAFTTNSAPVKLEYIKIGDGITPVRPSEITASSTTSCGTGDFTAGGLGELIVGRGCTGSVIHLWSSNNGRQYSFRIESGQYSIMNPQRNGGSGSANANNWSRIVLGCDFDRAAGENENLRIINYVGACRNSSTGNDSSELQDITVKSGYYGFVDNYALYSNTRNTNHADGFGLGIGGNTDGYSGTYTPTGTSNSYSFPSASNPETANNQTWIMNMSFYVGPTRGAGKGGVNRLLVEGGEFNNINGGGTNPGNSNTIGFYFRMKGGWVKGAVYGTASISNSDGSRRLVFTGGEVNGWVAGGCNGTDFGNGDGYNAGICYIYAGGRTEFRSHGRDGVYTNASGLVFNVPGGQIFGAGRGLAPSTTSNPQYCGSTTTAYVVVADEAEVEQHVYGGGYNGVSQYSHVYITGGTVGGKVFGGTAKAVSTHTTWRCRTTDVRMYGGTVKGGVYGGHDETGIQYSNADVQILGGTVGAEDQKLGDGSRNHDLGNVFGGGYGVATSIQGNVVVIVGDSTARTPHVDSPLIWGNVFGGGHEANYTSNGKTFKVLGYNGTVKQSVFGGGKGSGHNDGKITGDTHIWLKGSIEVGNVFGGGMAGEVDGSTYVKISD